MTVVEFSEMRDKRSQQRHRRADGAIGFVADRSAVEENCALAPQTTQASQGRSPVDRKPPGAGRDSVDSPQWGSLAGLAGEISAPLDLLAATARLGRAGRLVEYLAHVFERVKRARATGLERVLFGREFCFREKRGCGVGKTKRGKGTKWMVVVDGQGVPLGDQLCSASPAEVKLAETTLASIRVGRRHHAGRPRQKPERVITDRAYDSDPLRTRLRRRGIELICPHKKNRVRAATQDGRALRRYRKRWVIERTIGWLGNFRRLVVRYDRSLKIYGAFFHIACFMIVLRRVVQ